MYVCSMLVTRSEHHALVSLDAWATTSRGIQFVIQTSKTLLKTAYLLKTHSQSLLRSRCYCVTFPQRNICSAELRTEGQYCGTGSIA